MQKKFHTKYISIFRDSSHKEKYFEEEESEEQERS